MRTCAHLGPVFCTALLVGCGSETPEVQPFGTIIHELVVENDTLINGVQLNGTTTNGRVLNGRVLNGVRLTGVMLYGASVSNVTLSQTVFTGTQSGRTISGNKFTGSDFLGVLDDGTSITLHIDKISNGPSPNNDLKLYYISYRTTTGSQPLCGQISSGDAIPAWPINGRFDEKRGDYIADTTAYQFACRGAAVAKCLEAGYRPWEPLPSGTGTLQDHFLACTRMLRNDYCGDGKPGTQNGTPIDVYDTLNILQSSTTWNVEAEWTPDGASCVTRDPTRTRWHRHGIKKYGCWDGLRSATCGDFTSGGLIADRFN
jgi:hypothetical protein